MPRPLGALAALLAGVAAFALVIYLLIPPFVDQTNQFVDDVPGIVQDLEGRVERRDRHRAERGGRPRAEVVRRGYTDDPERLIGPITSIGLNVAGVIGALVLILITAYYMAVRPAPLVDGLVSLAPPSRREHVRHVLSPRPRVLDRLDGGGGDRHAHHRRPHLHRRSRSSGWTSRSSSPSCPRCSWWCPTSARSRERCRRSCSRSPTHPARRCWCSPPTRSSSSWRATSRSR